MYVLFKSLVEWVDTHEILTSGVQALTFQDGLALINPHGFTISGNLI